MSGEPGQVDIGEVDRRRRRSRSRHTAGTSATRSRARPVRSWPSAKRWNGTSRYVPVLVHIVTSPIWNVMPGPYTCSAASRVRWSAIVGAGRPGYVVIPAVMSWLRSTNRPDVDGVMRRLSSVGAWNCATRSAPTAPSGASPTEPVDRSTVLSILDDARFAPSGGNRQPWRVAIVEDRALRRDARRDDAAGVGRVPRAVRPRFRAVQCHRLEASGVDHTRQAERPADRDRDRSRSCWRSPPTCARSP